MKIYITHLLQILNFSSTFRQSEIKNSLCRPAMVADNISNLVAPPQNFFHFYRSGNNHQIYVHLVQSLKKVRTFQEFRIRHSSQLNACSWISPGE